MDATCIDNSLLIEASDGTSYEAQKCKEDIQALPLPLLLPPSNAEVNSVVEYKKSDSKQRGKEKNIQVELLSGVKGLATLGEKIYSLNSKHAVNPASLYQQIDLIGEGAYGKVYKMYNALENQVYALKRIDLIEAVEDTLSVDDDPNHENYDGAHDGALIIHELEGKKNKESQGSRMKHNISDSIDLLLKEVRILSKLDHPNVIRFNTSWIEIENERPILCIQTKLYPTTLDEYIKSSDLSQETTNKLWISLISGLQYLHAMKCVHRDIKPSNIYIDFNYYNIDRHSKGRDGESDRECKCVLGDFGLSKFMDDSTSQFMSDKYIGTELYLAPEAKRRKKPIYGTFSDIYSLGIIYLQLFSEVKTVFEFIELVKGLKFDNNEGKVINLPKDIEDKVDTRLLYLLLHPNYQLRLTANELLKYCL